MEETRAEVAMVCDEVAEKQLSIENLDEQRAGAEASL